MYRSAKQHKDPATFPTNNITILAVCCMLLLLLPLDSAIAQVTNWTGGGTTDNWSDVGNWDNGIPQEGYDVNIVAPSGISRMDISYLRIDNLDMSLFAGTFVLAHMLEITYDMRSACTVEVYSQDLYARRIYIDYGVWDVQNSDVYISEDLHLAGVFTGEWSQVEVGRDIYGYVGGALDLEYEGYLIFQSNAYLAPLDSVSMDDWSLSFQSWSGGSITLDETHVLGNLIILAYGSDIVYLQTVGGTPTMYGDCQVGKGILDLSGADMHIIGTTTISEGARIQNHTGSGRSCTFDGEVIINDGSLAFSAPNSSLRFADGDTVHVNGTSVFHVLGGVGGDRITIENVAGGANWILDHEPTATTYIRNANIAYGTANPLLTVYNCGDIYNNTGFIFVDPDIDLSTELLSFGNVTPYHTASDSLVIYNVGTDTLFINSFNNTLAEFTWDSTPPFVVTPAGSIQVAVEFAPQAVASFVDSLLIVSSDYDEDSVYVDLTGTSYAPDLLIATAAMRAPVTIEMDTVTVMFTVENIGTENSGSFRVSMRISSDTNYTLDDPEFTYLDVGGLLIGQDTTAIMLATIPSDAPRGNVYMGFIADALEAIDESDENNNTTGVLFSYHVPIIQSVMDVPGDQGGQVFLSWYASPPDLSGGITEYTLWRTIDVPLEQSEAATVIRSAKEWGPMLSGPVIRIEESPLGPIFWEHIATHDAFRRDAYGMALPTLFDSTAVAFDYHYFQVIAHTSDPGTYYMSAADSGYSIDNLAPAMPQDLAAEQTAPEVLQLTWDANSEADLSHYAVYRGADSDFTPGPQNLIGNATEPELFDDEWDWQGDYYYKVSALDIHGNESQHAVLGPDLVVGAGDTAPPKFNFLEQNWPNPFNASTRIVFGIAEDSDVELRIFDVAGRLVRTLVNDHRRADRYSVEWDGHDNDGRRVSGGVYFYMIEAGAFEKTHKMILIR